MKKSLLAIVISILLIGLLSGFTLQTSEFWEDRAIIYWDYLGKNAVYTVYQDGKEISINDRNSKTDLTSVTYTARWDNPNINHVIYVVARGLTYNAQSNSITITPYTNKVQYMALTDAPYGYGTSASNPLVVSTGSGTVDVTGSTVSSNTLAGDGTPITTSNILGRDALDVHASQAGTWDVDTTGSTNSAYIIKSTGEIVDSFGSSATSIFNSDGSAITVTNQLPIQFKGQRTTWTPDTLEQIDGVDTFIRGIPDVLSEAITRTAEEITDLRIAGLNVTITAAGTLDVSGSTLTVYDITRIGGKSVTNPNFATFTAGGEAVTVTASAIVGLPEDVYYSLTNTSKQLTDLVEVGTGVNVTITASGNLPTYLIDSTGSTIVAVDSYGALLTMPIEHHKIHKELSFVAAKKFTNTGTTGKSIMVYHPTKNIHLKWTIGADVETHAYLYEGGTFAGGTGTTITAKNRNRTSTVLTEPEISIIEDNLTVPDETTLLWAAVMGSTGVGGSRGSGDAMPGDEIECKAGVHYYFYVSPTNATNDWKWLIDFYTRN